MRKSMYAFSFIWTLTIWCIGASNIDFEAFEAEYFPRFIQFRRDGETRPLPQISYHDLVYHADLTRKCGDLNYSPEECKLLWSSIKSTIYNPEGNLFTRDYLLDIEFSSEVLMAEHLNFQTICKENEECLLFQENEFAMARSIFSAYTSMDILRMQRVVFLHSCTLPTGTTAVLESLLVDLDVSGLIVDTDKVFVINYGLQLSANLKGKYPTVVFVEASGDIARFEIPTLQIVHYFSRLFSSLRLHVQAAGESGAATIEDCHVLYVHTKGVSTSVDVAPVADWRRFMSYFVIRHHKKCQTLLNTDKYDAVGVNVRKSPQYPWQEDHEVSPHFSGNFWWSRASYLASLPFLSLGRNSKYDGEFWIGGADTCRLLSIHDSRVDDHYGTPYPENAYSNNTFLLSIEPF